MIPDPFIYIYLKIGNIFKKLKIISGRLKIIDLVRRLMRARKNKRKQK
jgi:hypothetical protein